MKLPSDKGHSTKLSGEWRCCGSPGQGLRARHPHMCSQHTGPLLLAQQQWNVKGCGQSSTTSTFRLYCLHSFRFRLGSPGNTSSCSRAKGLWQPASCHLLVGLVSGSVFLVGTGCGDGSTMLCLTFLSEVFLEVKPQLALWKECGVPRGADKPLCLAASLGAWTELFLHQTLSWMFSHQARPAGLGRR